jgi:hypothetical protein
LKLPDLFESGAIHIARRVAVLARLPSKLQDSGAQSDPQIETKSDSTEGVKTKARAMGPRCVRSGMVSETFSWSA